jgi:hypothetical protein
VAVLARFGKGKEMSGTSGQNSIYESVGRQVSNGITPKISNMYSFPLTLVAGAVLELDLKPLFNLHRIQNPQGIFIDNSEGTDTCTFSTSGGPTVSIAAGWQALLPLYMSADGVFNVSGDGSVDITLLNFPTPAAVWPSNSAANQVSVVGTVTVTDPIAEGYLANLQPGVGLVSHSVTSTAAGASTALMSANAARKYLYIGSAYNVAGVAFHDIWVNPLGGTAGVGLPDCVPILGGTYYESASKSWIGAITYFDAVGGNELTAFEG